MQSNKLLIKNIRVYAENHLIEQGFIKIESGIIREIGSMDRLTHESEYETVSITDGYLVRPGMIDLHIHGVNGADVMDATPEALSVMAKTLPVEGTTSFLATTMTQSPGQIEKALMNAGRYIHTQPSAGQAEVLGIHLEGPFINPSKAGAQPAEFIIDPNLEVFREWNAAAEGTIKVVTLAPERSGGMELIGYLAERNIIASIGHTDADFETVNQAIEAGATHVTHLFNQMKGLHHREPGTAGAALLKEELLVEIIVDGIHVRPEMVKLAYRQKSKSGLVLITDSMRAKCLNSGIYDLGGQAVTVKDGKALLADGTLAGSIVKMEEAARNMMTFTGCSLTDIIQMTSVNPAVTLGIFDRKGSIAEGKDADLLILNEDHEVVMTLCRGQISYQQEG